MFKLWCERGIKRHNRIYLLLSKHTYRAIRVCVIMISVILRNDIQYRVITLQLTESPALTLHTRFRSRRHQGSSRGHFCEHVAGHVTGKGLGNAKQKAQC